MDDKHLTLREVLQSASPDIRKTVNEILEIEHEYQNYKNLSSVTSIEKEIGSRIKQLIEREVKK